jgi:hypothetical protein
MPRDLLAELDAEPEAYRQSWKHKPGDAVQGAVVRYDKAPTP